MINEYKKNLIATFCDDNGVNKALIVLFSLINGIVLFNAIFHDPRIGYDSYHHLEYIRVLSDFRLPTPNETHEFFSPPLPYLIPSLLYSLTFSIFSNHTFSFGAAAKFAQFLNVIFSIGLTFYVLKICDTIRPNSSLLKIISLFFIGILPVYYKTFSFVRGEPLVAFLYVFVVYRMIIAFVQNKFSVSNVIVLGAAIGLLILARQWGFFIFPVITLFLFILALKLNKQAFLLSKAFVVIVAIALLVGGWFYLHLYTDFGSAKAFNRSADNKFSFSNQPIEFYKGLGLDKLFKDPVRKSFPNQFLPTFYSEIWGDYWCLFNVYGVDVRNNRFVSGEYLEKYLSKGAPPVWLKTNRYEMNKYLGRVNLISIFVSGFMLAGIFFAMIHFGKFLMKRNIDNTVTVHALLFLIILTSAFGYFWFLVMYPSLGKGDTIKATYLLHIFPFVSILAALILLQIRRKVFTLYILILSLLGISALHNFPAYITRYFFWPFSYF